MYFGRVMREFDVGALDFGNDRYIVGSYSSYMFTKFDVRHKIIKINKCFLLILAECRAFQGAYL